MRERGGNPEATKHSNISRLRARPRRHTAISIHRILRFVIGVAFVAVFIGHTATSKVVAFSVDSMSSSTTRKGEGPVILVIGACALDRLLTVSSYPEPDAKIRTNSYNEQGGGNAANTASGKIYMFMVVRGMPSQRLGNLFFLAFVKFASVQCSPQSIPNSFTNI